jgi:hypothetical protein
MMTPEFRFKRILCPVCYFIFGQSACVFTGDDLVYDPVAAALVDARDLGAASLRLAF